MSASALGGAVREAMGRVRLGVPPTVTEMAALRQQAREADLAVGALLRPAAEEER